MEVEKPLVLPPKFEVPLEFPEIIKEIKAPFIVVEENRSDHELIEIVPEKGPEKIC